MTILTRTKSQTYLMKRLNNGELNYSASNSGKGEEIMIFCDDIVIPKHKLFNHSTK